MSFDQLPYEVQFNYLKRLPYSDILHYCETSTTAYNICQTPFFWEEKAQHDYQISLKIIPGNNPQEQYQELITLYEYHPDFLIAPVIRSGNYKLLEELLARTDLNMSSERQNIADAAMKAGPEIVKLITQYIRSSPSALIIRALYLSAIRAGQPELIEQYYDPQSMPYIEYDYYDAIRNGDFRVIEYLPKIIGHLIRPHGEFNAAFASLNREVITYFLARYLYILNSPTFVNGIVEEFIITGNFASLALMVEYLSPLIDFDRAKHTIQIVYASNPDTQKEALNALIH